MLVTFVRPETCTVWKSPIVTDLVNLTCPLALLRSISGSFNTPAFANICGGKFAVSHACGRASFSSLVANCIASWICKVPVQIGTLLVCGLLLETINSESLFIFSIPGVANLAST